RRPGELDDPGEEGQGPRRCHGPRARSQAGDRADGARRQGRQPEDRARVLAAADRSRRRRPGDHRPRGDRRRDGRAGAARARPRRLHRGGARGHRAAPACRAGLRRSWPVDDTCTTSAGGRFVGMADLFEGYPRGAAWDEMMGPEPDGADGIRAPYQHVHRTMGALDADELRLRADALARSYLNQGVTFDIGGEERPFPLDAVPRVLDGAEWDHLAPGIAQRVRALEALLADVYGEQKVIADGVLPRRLILSSAHFHRAAMGIHPANGVRVHVAGIDVIRDSADGWRVLEDNVRVPSGVSYVLSNRRAMAQSFPELFSRMRIRPVADYPRRLLAALTAAAPPGVDDPVVVVLTPGAYNSAYFEHSLLARLMGVELVEGRDLVCAGDRVYMRTTEGRRR